MSTQPTPWTLPPSLTLRTDEPTCGAEPHPVPPEAGARPKAPAPRRPRLTGNRNQCPTCSKLFNSLWAFDKHRTGTIGIDRRCMTAAEMQSTGMVLRADGFWVGSLMRPDSPKRSKEPR